MNLNNKHAAEDEKPTGPSRRQNYNPWVLEELHF